MDNKFNRKGKGFGAGRKDKTKNGKKSTEVKPSSKDIELATIDFIKNGGEIERFIKNPVLYQN